MVLVVIIGVVVPRARGNGYDWGRDHSSLQKNPWGTLANRHG